MGATIPPRNFDQKNTAITAKSRRSTKRKSNVPAQAGKQDERFDLLDHPMFFFAHIVSRFDANVAVDLRRHAMSQSDWRIISTLQYSDDLTLTEIARITTLERSFVGRMVGELKKRGLVRSDSPENDRRTTLVRLTEAGRAAFTGVLLPIVAEQLGVAYQGVGDADRATFARILRQLMRNVYQAAREAAPLLD